MVHDSCKTPRYVLKDGSNPTRPPVLKSSAKIQPTAIFGFSDKPEYDAFLNASPLALTPYPIVKGFLENQIALSVDAVRLIVLDASSPNQRVFKAATFQSVLESFRLGLDRVAISHQLILDESSQEYLIQIVAEAANSKSVDSSP